MRDGATVGHHDLPQVVGRTQRNQPKQPMRQTPPNRPLLVRSSAMSLEFDANNSIDSPTTSPVVNRPVTENRSTTEPVAKEPAKPPCPIWGPDRRAIMDRPSGRGFCLGRVMEQTLLARRDERDYWLASTNKAGLDWLSI